MIPLTFLYNEYIDLPKLSKQKKLTSVYSSTHHKWGRNNCMLYENMSLLGLDCNCGDHCGVGGFKREKAQISTEKSTIPNDVSRWFFQVPVSATSCSATMSQTVEYLKEMSS